MFDSGQRTELGRLLVVHGGNAEGGVRETEDSRKSPFSVETTFSGRGSCGKGL